MPKLLFDFLELKKEQLTINKEHSTMQTENEKTAIHWNSIALGSGIALSF